MRAHRPEDAPTSRRQVILGAATTVLVGLAGCATGESSAPTDSTRTQRSTSEGAATSESITTSEPEEDGPSSTANGPTDGAPNATPNHDLREANVVGVEVERTDDAYRFAVTLYHDDDGEDGYADWWQVETTAGERIGRRELLHAHGTQPFTRSETIEIPDDVRCVVVRGHDQTHGYGGRAMLVNLASGATVAVEQGPERRDVDPSGCP